MGRYLPLRRQSSGSAALPLATGSEMVCAAVEAGEDVTTILVGHRDAGAAAEATHDECRVAPIRVTVREGRWRRSGFDPKIDRIEQLLHRPDPGGDGLSW
jgi:hypothetical protein